MIFEWNAKKAESNLQKHGVSFEEAATIFDDAFTDVVPDLGHSADESRWIATGASAQQRLLVVVFTEKGDVIRLISARTATPAERKDYES